MKTQIKSNRLSKADKINHVVNNIMLIGALIVVGLLLFNALKGVFWLLRLFVGMVILFIVPHSLLRTAILITLTKQNHLH